MSAYKKIIGIVFFAVIIWFLYKSVIKVHVGHPESCSFSFDLYFSDHLQQEIRSYIQTMYESEQNFSSLLPLIQAKFYEIRSIVLDMKNPISVHFTIQSYVPLCIINNSIVLSEEGYLFNRSAFHENKLTNLENVLYEDSLKDLNLQRFISFIKSLPAEVIQDFSIRWFGKYNVWLDSKQEDDFSLLVNYESPIKISDIMQCKALRGHKAEPSGMHKKSKSCKDKVTWVCDLRFDQQIVLFSTNKGG